MSFDNIREHIITLLSNGCTNIYTNNTQSAFTTYFNRSLKLTGNWVVGLTEVTLNKNCSKPRPIEPDEYKFYNPYHNKHKLIGETQTIGDNCDSNDDDGLYSYVFLYLDIMEPRFVGNQSTKCVRSFLKKNSERVSFEFKNIQYHPLCVSSVSDISILIADSTGGKVQFTPSYLPNAVTLHLKKID